MRHSDESHSQNGYPSWQQFFDIASEIKADVAAGAANVGNLRIGLGYLRDQWHRDLTRVHQRIDETQSSLHEKIDDVRDQMITLQATLEDPTRRRGRAARLRDWAELIAPLRELLLMACIVAAGLAGLAQAPTVRDGLDRLAGRLVHQAAE